jgi:hypothetical protein
MTPLPGETSTKSFLKKLTVAQYADPYGNDYLGGVKAFDREANRYGYNYSAKNDFNNQKPEWPLANPSLNVNTGRTDESRVFEAIDAVGLGALIHWRVLNTLTGEYVTKQVHKEDATRIARDLNNEFVKLLGEARKENAPIASLPIQEGLHTELNPKYLQALQRQNYTSSK